MKGVFRDYLPKSYVDDHIVNVYHCTGSDFVNTSSEKFDKVELFFFSNEKDTLTYGV